jgi:hypothetical protein
LQCSAWTTLYGSYCQCYSLPGICGAVNTSPTGFSWICDPQSMVLFKLYHTPPPPRFSFLRAFKCLVWRPWTEHTYRQWLYTHPPCQSLTDESYTCWAIAAWCCSTLQGVRCATWAVTPGRTCWYVQPRSRAPEERKGGDYKGRGEY